jgi:N6-adenosine-specific RNA methylase IME4
MCQQKWGSDKYTIFEWGKMKARGYLVDSDAVGNI